LLTAVAARTQMDLWLAECAAAGFEPGALVPASLVLPAADKVIQVGRLGGEDLARSAQAAFAGEPSLVEALGGGQSLQETGDAALLERLALVHAEPPLNLRQGPYAPRRVAFYLLPDWRQLARMAATAALLALVFMLVWIVKWNLDSTAQEEAALAAAQAKFPAATDLDSATRLVEGELARRGEGGAAFSAPAAAVLGALKGQPTVTLRDLGYSGDGTLRFTAAAPAPDAINQILFTLQNDGWKVTVPPSLAPDPTGATVAAITVRAP
jgi:general secretion pathway protein L